MASSTYLTLHSTPPPIDQQRFLFSAPDIPANKEQLKQEILSIVTEHSMAPLYETICTELGVAVDNPALQSMKTANTTKMEALNKALVDAEENAGDIEIRDALQAKAEFYASICDLEAAKDAFEIAEKKTAGAGPKMDLAFSMLILEMSLSNWHAVKAKLDQAKSLCDKGGDWERKNRLRVYEAVFEMSRRNFTRAAELFLEAIPTFTATELLSYDQCVYYTIILAPVALDRPALKSKVIDSPEILSVIDVLPSARQFLHSLHGCAYADFFKAFAELCDVVRADRYLYNHFKYWMREVRVVAYCQFLEPYKSVTLAAMAAAFGVCVDFLDEELSDSIVAGRIPAKIDRVAGVVETNRPDGKNGLYQQVIKGGDLLLNRLQKLSKVVDVEA